MSTKAYHNNYQKYFLVDNDQIVEFQFKTKFSKIEILTKLSLTSKSR